ncbi:hypothetical protein JTB14_005069 [Gonioctena quinquepunctata]|nr:hypothetical protein JTB14_005069 [Gonioctena quinquepunctata]
MCDDTKFPRLTIHSTSLCFAMKQMKHTLNVYYALIHSVLSYNIMKQHTELSFRNELSVSFLDSITSHKEKHLRQNSYVIIHIRSCLTRMEQTKPPPKKERNFPNLDLTDQTTLNAIQQPVLIVQSPKTPTLSKKLKAVSLDSDPPETASNLDVSRDVFSMPNTPKRHIKSRLSCDFEDGPQRSTLAPSFSSNLKKFASNTSISGSQTLKTLPEIMTLQDFSDGPVVAPMKIKAKGLLERRGSNASLTIDLGSNSSIPDAKPLSFTRLNTAKSVSNLNLSTFEGSDKSCHCLKKCEIQAKVTERRKSQETCGNCTIYESVPSKMSSCKVKCQILKKCNCCLQSRRKSLSNENLYVPPCGFCQTGALKDSSGASKHCKGYRKACYPRQPDLESSQLLSEDFKLHLQNIQYLQTAGNILSISDLQQACEVSRVPKLHQEFWEVPLNLQEKCYASGSQSRNRYRGVLPNEHSRVHLSASQSYIHANYIKGPDYTETSYIATQGPMTHTCQDFWEMVWSTHCKCIVMLTGLIEKGRSKCELYFPLGKKDNTVEKSFFYVKTTKVRDKFSFETKNNTQQYDEETHAFEELNEISFGNYKITFIQESSLDECQIRQLEIKKTDSAEQARTVHHYWFSDWPDHKMASPEQVLKIALDVLNIMDSTKKSDNNFSDISKSIDESLLKSTKNQSDLRTRGCHDKLKSADKSMHFINKRESTLALLKNNPPQERRKSTENIKLPIIVHCSAGIGRTGCFLAILNGIQQLKSNSNVDILAILCSLRLNRGGMVQTAEQYELIHRVLSLYTESMT